MSFISCWISRSLLVAICLFIPICSLAAAGDLDPAFGTGGKLTDLSGSADAVAIQPDGKLIVVGGTSGGFTSTAFVVARYDANGSRDITFGGNGQVTTDIGYSYEHAQAVAIQSDGKIVVAGTTWDGARSQWGHFSLVRYNTDGSLDLPFGGGDGIVVTGNLGTGWVTANAVAIQADGKIVVGGMSDYNMYDFPYLTVIRYNPDGSLDLSFGGDGIGENSIFMRFEEARSIAIQADGKIVAAGHYRPGNNDFDFAIARYNTNGTLDTTFSRDGIVNTRIGPYSDQVNSVAIQTDGKIVVAGFSYVTRQYLTVARYDPDGSLDPTFDGDGIVTILIGSDAAASSIAIQSDSKLVAAGTSHNGFNTDFAIARFNSDGSLDPSFGGGDGSTTLDFDNSNDKAYGMSLDKSARAVVVGDSQGRFALSRFQLDPSASVSGRVTTPAGLGLRNATVSITNPVGVTRTATTSTVGFYSFTDIPTGHTYTISVASRRYRFVPRTLDINNNLLDIDLVGLE